jgi:hypothetical protein
MLINEEKTVYLSRSAPEPTHRFDLFHYVTSCSPILDGGSPPAPNHSFASKMARYSHHQPCCYICSDQSAPYSPHRHTSLLHPTLESNGFYPECARLQLLSPNRFGSHSG